MSDFRDTYRRRADRFTAVVDALPADAWGAPSACAGWSAADVLAHVIDTQRDFFGTHGVELGARPAGDPPADWAAHRAAVETVDDEVLHREYDGYFGRTTVGATLVDFYGFDLVVHRWDIARAAGRDERFGETELDEIEREIPVMGEALYSDGVCARPVPVPDGADRQQRVLALLGRAS